MATKDERKHELFRFPLQILLKEYKRIKNIPNDTELTGILVSKLIQTILDAEFPKPK